MNVFLWGISANHRWPISRKAALQKIRHLEVCVAGRFFKSTVPKRWYADGNGADVDTKEVYTRDVTQFFELFECGRNLRTLHLLALTLAFDLNVVEETMKAFKGLDVHGTIKISKLCEIGQSVMEIDDDCKERIIDAIRKN